MPVSLFLMFHQLFVIIWQVFGHTDFYWPFLTTDIIHHQNHDSVYLTMIILQNSLYIGELLECDKEYFEWRYFMGICFGKFQAPLYTFLVQCLYFVWFIMSDIWKALGLGSPVFKTAN